jgi:hypothetical protein
MPQAPLPAPAARIQPYEFHPYVQQFQPPFNVLPYMKYPDMIDHAVKGLQLGTALMKLPTEAREQATQRALQGILQTGTKFQDQYVKDLIAGKIPSASGGKMTPTEISQALSAAMPGVGQGGGATLSQEAQMANFYRMLQAKLLQIQTPELRDQNPPPPPQPPQPQTPPPTPEKPKGELKERGWGMIDPETGLPAAAGGGMMAAPIRTVGYTPEGSAPSYQTLPYSPGSAPGLQTLPYPRPIPPIQPIQPLQFVSAQEYNPQVQGFYGAPAPLA